MDLEKKINEIEQREGLNPSLETSINEKVLNKEKNKFAEKQENDNTQETKKKKLKKLTIQTESEESEIELDKNKMNMKLKQGKKNKIQEKYEHDEENQKIKKKKQLIFDEEENNESESDRTKTGNHSFLENNDDDDNNDDEIGSDEDDNDDEQEVYIVEKILKKRIKDKKCEYFVKWQGFPSSNNTWEPLSNLENIQNMIYQFEYGLSQTGKVPKYPKKLLKNLCPTKIERIFGHDMIRNKNQYLVAYSQIPEPRWVGKNELPISYLNQYKKCIQNNQIQCILEQINPAQMSNSKYSLLLKSNQDNQDESKVSDSLFNQDKFISAEIDKFQENLQNDAISESVSKSQQSGISNKNKQPKSSKKDEVYIKSSDISNINSKREGKKLDQSQLSQINSSIPNLIEQQETKQIEQGKLSKKEQKISEKKQQKLDSLKQQKEHQTNLKLVNSLIEKHTSNFQNTKSNQDTLINSELNTKPIQSLDTKPILPSDTKQIKTLDPKSLQGQDTKPIKPLDTKPIQPLDTKPIQSLDTKPVQQLDTKPIQSLDTKSIQRQDVKPIQDKKPIQQLDTKVIQGQDKKVLPEQENGKSIQGQETNGIQELETKGIQGLDKKVVQSLDTKVIQSVDKKFIQNVDTKVIQNLDRKISDKVKQNENQLVKKEVDSNNVSEQRAHFIIKDEGETPSQPQLVGASPKEGSFEYKDKILKVIIRSSEKELEAMIFEVFWKPRPDCACPKSKLVRYDELKKYSPESLIYWLEVMVKNSVKELEKDDLIIKDLKDEIKNLNDQIQSLLKQITHPLPLNGLTTPINPQEQNSFIPEMVQSPDCNIILKNQQDKQNTLIRPIQHQPPQLPPQFFPPSLQNIHFLQKQNEFNNQMMHFHNQHMNNQHLNHQMMNNQNGNNQNMNNPHLNIQLINNPDHQVYFNQLKNQNGFTNLREQGFNQINIGNPQANQPIQPPKIKTINKQFVKVNEQELESSSKKKGRSKKMNLNDNKIIQQLKKDI